VKDKAEKLKAKFLEVFGDNGRKLAVVKSPGRVNLIGEHTDYNEGYVLPMAVDREIWVAAQRRTDRMLALYSADFDEKIQVPSANLKYLADDGWANYPKGVLWALENSGHRPEGYNILISSTIPQGAGLSSSAALELAVALAMTVLGDWPWDAVSMAKLCQRAENQFVGVNCGIMDQLAVAATKASCALFLDCRSLEFQHVPVNFSDAQFVVVNSGVTRGLKGSEYNTRREECQQALKVLQGKNPKYQALRDVGVVAFERYKSNLPGKLRMRAEHVVYENDRVLKAREALASGDAAAFGSLMVKSHRSLQKLYEVSCPELDTLVDYALAIPGVHGARLTGAGFGGCTINLVANGAVENFKTTLVREYRRKINLQATVMPCVPNGPAEEIL
jgi:galactokinase